LQPAESFVASAFGSGAGSCLDCACYPTGRPAIASTGRFPTASTRCFAITSRPHRRSRPRLTRLLLVPGRYLGELAKSYHSDYLDFQLHEANGPHDLPASRGAPRRSSAAPCIARGGGVQGFCISGRSTSSIRSGGGRGGPRRSLRSPASSTPISSVILSESRFISAISLALFLTCCC
jgi:hypothetical protein